MPGVMKLYTDASVRGDILSAGTQTSLKGVRRSRWGHAMIAWIGWHDCAPESAPTIAGQAYAGRQATQRAEMKAAIHGLHAALVHARCGAETPDSLVLHVDNRTVASVLAGHWEANELRKYLEVAKGIIAELEESGIAVRVVEISERDSAHRKAHQMSKNAWNQVLIEMHWRPD